MSDFDALQRFLRTDPRDVGCDEAMRLMHVYAELALVDPLQAAESYPGVLAHLENCGPCSQDYAGLLAALRGEF
jgi:hypothetical protein